MDTSVRKIFTVALAMVLPLYMCGMALGNTHKTVAARVTMSDGSYPALADITVTVTDAYEQAVSYSDGADPGEVIYQYDEERGIILILLEEFAGQWMAEDILQIFVASGTEGIIGYEDGTTFATLTAENPQTFINDANLDFATAYCYPTGNAETTCDGIDDDCDGEFDEDYVQDSSCFLPGECVATNAPSTCVAGVETACTPGIPVDEICDNADNDCDGTTDENLTQTTSCGVGECASTGTAICEAGSWKNDTCTPGAPTQEVCDNADNDCDGTTDENLTQTTSCGVGECAGNTGQETCTAGIWGNDTCNPLAGSSAEVCDNADNDCDGVIDDNVTRPTSCGVGECVAAGVETCSGGTWGNDTCSPGAPTQEVCDNADNDCDGTTDENLTQTTSCGVGQCAAAGIATCSAGAWINDTCTPGAAAAETCDNLDNDCDGAVDEGLTQPTSCGAGQCAATGEKTCTAGVWGNDTCTPGGSLGEICDNIDNDCDGAIDEDLTRETSCGVGGCASSGIETCAAGAWGGDTCTPGDSAAEVCDNSDNDCDGTVDEDLSRATSCGVGECAGNTGQETCTAGTWGNDTCNPLAGSVPEVCDNFDNDCDGTIDDGLTRATNCGAGGCIATGVETCTAGVWGNDTCTPGGSTPEICDNADNDCDGAIDENLSRVTSCGVGECASTGTAICEAGSWINDTCAPGSPSPETCDNLDNDCDGAIDEGQHNDTADADGDGSPDACEAADGNKDGTPDSEQGHVATLFVHKINDSVTLHIDKNNFPDCTLKKVSTAQDEPEPEGVECPFGLFNFTIDCTGAELDPPGHVMITLRMPGGTNRRGNIGVNTYYKIDSQGNWHDFRRVDGAGPGVDFLDDEIYIYFIDDAFGDDDDTPGIIVDPGAPALVDGLEDPPTSGSSSGGGGGGGGGIFGDIARSSVLGYHLDGIAANGVRIYMPVTRGFKALKGAQEYVRSFAPQFAEFVRECFDFFEQKADANKEGLLYRLGTRLFPVLGKIAEESLELLGQESYIDAAYSETTISVAEFRQLERKGLAVAPKMTEKAARPEHEISLMGVEY
jgi:hypothetical protein